MQMSSIWSRHAMKNVKGNHRRIRYLGINILWGYKKYL